MTLVNDCYGTWRVSRKGRELPDDQLAQCGPEAGTPYEMYTS